MNDPTITSITLIFRYIALAQVLFSISYLLLFRQKRTTLLLFVFFFFFICSPNVLHVLIGAGYVDQYPRLNFLPIGFYYFAMPMYYLYVKSLFEKVTYREISIYLIPGIVEFLFLLVLFCMPISESIAFYQHYNWIFTWFFGILLNAFSLLFLVLVVLRINRYHKKYLNFFSNTQKVDLNWVKYTSLILIANYIFQAVTIPFLFEQSQKQMVYLVDSIVTVVYIYWVSTYGINQNHIPHSYQIFENAKILPNIQIEDFEKIKQLVLSDKLYKSPTLTVVDVADLVAIHPKKVSQAINEFSGKNFNNFINAYRIEEAKILLSDPKYDNLTIEALAKEAGFNSKSVFNTLFKADTGMTPNAFKTSAAA